MFLRKRINIISDIKLNVLYFWKASKKMQPLQLFLMFSVWALVHAAGLGHYMPWENKKNGKSRQWRANYSRKPTIYPEPEFKKFKGFQASIPRNLFLARNQFRCGNDSWRHRSHLWRSPTRIHYAWQPQGDEKSIPALKINSLWDMADSIPYLVPTQFQESIPHITG